MLIFISYNHKDRDYARKIYEILQKQGFEVWFDDLIEYGGGWENTIKRKLEECEAVLLIMTRQAVSSPTIQSEIQRARELNKKIYPLLLEDVDENPLPQLRYIDVRGGILPPESFYRQLKIALSEQGRITAVGLPPRSTESLFTRILKRLAGDSSTDAPPPDVKKIKGK